MAKDLKIDPQILTKMEDMRTIIGVGFRSYAFTINEDPGGTSYTHSATDDQGNSITVSERKVKETSPK